MEEGRGEKKKKVRWGGDRKEYEKTRRGRLGRKRWKGCGKEGWEGKK